MSAISRLKSSSSFDELSGPSKKPKLSANDDEPRHACSTLLPSASKSKVRGIERLSLDQIPRNCIGTSDATLRNRRHFFLRQKTRLLGEGKLVIPGKCKFLSDGATLEWESESVVMSRSSVKPFAGRTEQTQAAVHPFGCNVQIPNGIEENSESFKSVEGNVPIDVMDVSSDSNAEIDELDPSDQENNGGCMGHSFHAAEKKEHTIIPHPGTLGSSFAAPIVLSDDEDDANKLGQPYSSTTKPPLEHEEDQHLNNIRVRCSRRRRITSSSLSSSGDEVTVTPSPQGAKKKTACRSSPDAKARSNANKHPQRNPLKRSPSIISVRSSPERNGRNVVLQEAKHAKAPKSTYARGRRILVQEKYLVTVSMRGDLQFFNAHERVREKALSLPWNPQNGKQHVEDACSVDEYGVVAFDEGSSQAVVVNGKTSTALAAKPHEGGISCLCAMGKSVSDIKFLSGGHDHTVRLWAISSIDYSTKVKTLGISNSSVVHALAYIPAQNRVVSASNHKLVLHDIQKDAPINKGPSSSSIHQIHVQREQPYIMATEVNHLDCQINIYDIRQGFTEKPPIIDMGYRGEEPFNPSRYERGDFRGSLFARGYKDGTVKVFDIRNPKAAVSTTLFCRDVPATHSIFWNATTIAAFGGTMLSFLDFRYS